MASSPRDGQSFRSPWWLALLLGGSAVHASGLDIVEHQVQPGDTLIALLAPGAPWPRVQRDNRIADPRRLRPGTILRIPAAWLREQPVQAEVVHAFGAVTVQRAGSADARPLGGGDRVAAGDRLRSGADGTATLRFVDGSTLLLRPGSELLVERLARSQRSVGTTLRLDSGAADSRVPPTPSSSRYEIRTPMARLGVRGTEFRTRSDAAATRAEVLEGRVAAGSGGRSQALDAGYGARLDGGAWRPLALPPAPDLGGLPGRVERLPLAFALPTQPTGGEPLWAEVFDATDPPRLRLAARFEAGPLRWLDDLPDGRYELRVRRIGAEGLEGLDARHRFELKARPEPPFVSAPAADAELTTGSVRFAWTQPSGVARVRLQVADDSGFTRLRVDRADLTGSEVTLELPLGEHHWRVASVRDDGDQGPFGDAQRLRRVEPPPPPPSPPDARPPEADSDGVRLRWSGPGSAGLRWQVQVARDAGFGDLVADHTVSEPTLQLGKLSPGTYHVRIRTLGSDGRAGPFGPPQQFDVPRSMWWLWLLPLLILL